MSRKDLKRFGCLLTAAVPVLWYIFAGFAWSAENPPSPHFPSANISYTPGSAVYLVNLKIDGLPAQAGDEVAFYDPRGAICGWAAVGADTAEYLLVTVYGDDMSTEAVVEGAKAGEVLTARVWDASAGVELSGTALLLVPGPPQGESFLPSAIPPVWQDSTFYVLHIDTTTHFGKAMPTPIVTNYIGYVSLDGVPATVGDELAVYDQNGVLSGTARLMDQGAYLVAVYGDDATTLQVDEGAVEGERLTFKIWDRSADREYGSSDIRLTPGTAQGDSVPSLLPPIWSVDKGYVLDLGAASLTKGDVNGDNRVDMGDAILALKVCVGFALAYPDVYQQADVNGDGRIGIEEAVYILQKAAALR